MATSNHPMRHAGKTSLRHVWLAGLGVVSVLRRETINANDQVLVEMARLHRRAVGLADGIKSRVVAGAGSARVQLDPIVENVGKAIRHRVASTLQTIGLTSSTARTGGRKLVAHTMRRAATGSSRRSPKG